MRRASTRSLHAFPQTLRNSRCGGQRGGDPWTVSGPCREIPGPFGCWPRCERSSAYRLGPDFPRRVRPRPISGKMCQFVPFCATPYLSGVPTVAQNVILVCHGILWIVGESAPRRGSTRAGSIYLLASACHEDRVARMYCPVQWPLRIIERPWRDSLCVDSSSGFARMLFGRRRAHRVCA